MQFHKIATFLAKSGGFVKFSLFGIVNTFSHFCVPYLLPIIKSKSIIAALKFIIIEYSSRSFINKITLLLFTSEK